MSKDNKDILKKLLDDMRAEREEGVLINPSSEEIEAVLKASGAPKHIIDKARKVTDAVKEFREATEVGLGLTPHDVSHALAELLRRSVQGCEFMQKLEKYLELPKSCKDSEGTEIRVGDDLTGGTLDKQIKRVLSLHFGYCTLSVCDEPSKDDGAWSENQIKERGWVIAKKKK